MIDPTGVEQLADLPRSTSVDQALERVWGYGEHTAFMPRDREEADAIFRACLDPGRVNLMVDEAHTYLTSRKGKDGPLLNLMRAHRHAEANVLLTTQHLTGDIPQEALSCAPRLFVFRCTSPAVLERLKQEGLDVERIAALPQGHWIEHYEGF